MGCSISYKSQAAFKHKSGKLRMRSSPTVHSLNWKFESFHHFQQMLVGFLGYRLAGKGVNRSWRFPNQFIGTVPIFPEIPSSTPPRLVISAHCLCSHSFQKKLWSTAEFRAMLTQLGSWGWINASWRGSYDCPRSLVFRYRSKVGSWVTGIWRLRYEW